MLATPGGLDDPAQSYLADGYYYRYYILGPYTDGFDNTNPNLYGTSSAEYFPFTPECYRCARKLHARQLYYSTRWIG